MCVCVRERERELGTGFRIGARLLALAWHCLISTLKQVCVLRFGTCAGSLMKYAVGVNAAAKMPNRESKRELEKDCEYVTPAAHFQPLLSPLYHCNYSFSCLSISACSSSGSLPFHSLPHPLNFSALILIHSPSHSHPSLSQNLKVINTSLSPLQPGTQKELFRVSAALVTLQVA